MIATSKILCNFVIRNSNANHENDQVIITKTYGASRKNFGNFRVVVTGFGQPSDAIREFLPI